MTSNPKESLLTVSGIFSEKFGRSISKKAMRKTKQNIAQVIPALLTADSRKHIRSEISDRFNALNTTHTSLLIEVVRDVYFASCCARTYKN